MTPPITYLASPNHSSRSGTAIALIVLHSTAGSLASSLDWLRNPKTKVSCHYLVAKSGAITQLVADDRCAWHAGNARWQGHADINERSIGIELENFNTGHDPYPAAQLDAARLLCRSLIGRYGIARAGVVRHMDIATPRGRKTDPAGFPWDSFVASVYALPEAPTLPTPVPRAYDVIGLPVYRRADRTGALWGYLLAGEHVTIDNLSNGHLADSRGFVDMNGLVVRSQ